jgi:antitoxin (DNA-binding transcriptional repressor) of toxin-antitoxin stability system
MKRTERVGIKRLKNNLSAYVRRVRKGERILVMDRDEVVAELRSARPEEPVHPLMADWISRGWVRPPLRARRPLPDSPIVSMPEGTAQRLIDEDRGE